MRLSFVRMCQKTEPIRNLFRIGSYVLATSQELYFQIQGFQRQFNFFILNHLFSMACLPMRTCTKLIAMGSFELPNNKPSRANRQKRRDKRLHEEVIECRRTGGGDSNKKCRTKGRAKRLQKERLSDAMPFRIPIREYAQPSLNDNLAPLLRYLQQSVGRRWDDVYAELSQKLDRSTVTGLHVFDHLWDYLEPFSFQKSKEKLEHYSPRKDGVSHNFRIHPVTGILCSYNPDYKHEDGPFPKKARFKKEKEQRKSKMWLGLPPEKAPASPVPQPEMLLRHILRHELGDDPKHPNWHLLTGVPFDLSDGVRRLMLKVETVQFGFHKPRYRVWGREPEPPIPNVVVGFRVTSQTFGQIRPDVRYYEGEWETAGERGALVRQISFRNVER
jgi:hypothetical protein